MWCTENCNSSSTETGAGLRCEQYHHCLWPGEASIKSHDDGLVLTEYSDFSNWIVWRLLMPLIARFMGPTRGPSGADRTQVGPMLASWTLLSGVPPNLKRPEAILQFCPLLFIRKCSCKNACYIHLYINSLFPGRYTTIFRNVIL